MLVKRLHVARRRLVLERGAPRLLNFVGGVEHSVVAGGGHER